MKVLGWNPDQCASLIWAEILRIESISAMFDRERVADAESLVSNSEASLAFFDSSYDVHRLASAVDEAKCCLARAVLIRASRNRQ